MLVAVRLTLELVEPAVEAMDLRLELEQRILVVAEVADLQVAQVLEDQELLFSLFPLLNTQAQQQVLQ
jgi:hypothetical protein